MSYLIIDNIPGVLRVGRYYCETKTEALNVFAKLVRESARMIGEIENTNTDTIIKKFEEKRYVSSEGELLIEVQEIQKEKKMSNGFLVIENFDEMRYYAFKVLDAAREKYNELARKHSLENAESETESHVGDKTVLKLVPCFTD